MANFFHVVCDLLQVTKTITVNWSDEINSQLKYWFYIQNDDATQQMHCSYYVYFDKIPYFYPPHKMVKKDLKVVWYVCYKRPGLNTDPR